MCQLNYASNAYLCLVRGIFCHSDWTAHVKQKLAFDSFLLNPSVSNGLFKDASKLIIIILTFSSHLPQCRVAFIDYRLCRRDSCAKPGSFYWYLLVMRHAHRLVYLRASLKKAFMLCIFIIYCRLPVVCLSMFGLLRLIIIAHLPSDSAIIEAATACFAYAHLICLYAWRVDKRRWLDPLAFGNGIMVLNPVQKTLWSGRVNLM